MELEVTYLKSDCTIYICASEQLLTQAVLQAKLSKLVFPHAFLPVLTGPLFGP